MRFISNKQSYAIWGVITFSILSLQVFNFVGEYKKEIDKHVQLNALQAKGYAEEVEYLIKSEVERVHQVSNVISYRLKDFLVQDHTRKPNPEHNDIKRHQNHHKQQTNNAQNVADHFLHSEATHWIRNTDKYLIDNFKIAIKYVVEDGHHVIYGDTDDSFWKTRYKPWLENINGEFSWQFVFSQYMHRINVYGINRLTDDLGHTYDVIIEFDEKFIPPSKFDSYHHFFLIAPNGVPFKLTDKRLFPITLKLPISSVLVDDSNYIEAFYGKPPEQYYEITSVERYGKKFVSAGNLQPVDFFYNAFDFDENGWRFIVLSDATPLAKGIEKEVSELYKKMGVTTIIAAALALILFYHFKVASMLQHDALTKLLNRNHFKEKKVELSNAQYRDRSYQIGLIGIDIDKFKLINDTYGHTTGDDVLLHLAQLMKTYSRDTDFVYRFGGEEFLIICPNYSAEQTAHLAERLRCAVESDENVLKILPQAYTISLGVTEKLVKETMEDAIKRADELLYKAKENGRNQVQIG